MANPICVHQVGKVGSTSVIETLRDLLPDIVIHQTHVLSSRALAASLSQWLERERRSPGIRIPTNLRSSIAMSSLLEPGVASDEWHVLSLVREPVGRNVSAFFENLRRGWIHHLPPESRDVCAGLFQKKTTMAPDENAIRKVAVDLVELFKAGYSRDFMDAWFDEEVRGVFGIDVLAEPFDQQLGWQLYRRGNVRLLLLRLENLEEVFEPGIRQWLCGSTWQQKLDAHAPLVLKRANEAGSKHYAQLHRIFLEKMTFDPALLEQEYASRTARTFYSAEERERFAAKWTK
jgi:Putative capsular polysaccharide synthesis protein